VRRLPHRGGRGTHLNKSVNFAANVTVSGRWRARWRWDDGGDGVHGHVHDDQLPQPGHDGVRGDGVGAWNVGGTGLACDACHYYSATPSGAANTGGAR